MTADPIRLRARLTALEQAVIALAGSLDASAKERMSERLQEIDKRMKNPLSESLFGADLQRADREKFGQATQEEWEWLKGQMFGRAAPDA